MLYLNLFKVLACRTPCITVFRVVGILFTHVNSLSLISAFTVRSSTVRVLHTQHIVLSHRLWRGGAAGGGGRILRQFLSLVPRTAAVGPLDKQFQLRAA